MENDINTSAQEEVDGFSEGWEETETAVSEQEEENVNSEQEQTTAPTGAETDTAKTTPVDDGSKDAEGTQVEKAEDSKEHVAETADGQPQDAQNAEEPKLYTLRHLDEEKTVNEQELTVLAQKGLDYDRIREKYDAAKPVMEIFANSAKASGMTVAEYVAFVRTEAKKATGMDDVQARRAVELEDRENAISAKEAEDAEKQAAAVSAARAKTADEERRKADLAEFQKTFPDAAKDPKSIPQSVWDKVKAGNSLVTAYALYQVEKAKSEAEAAKAEAQTRIQNAKNAGRSSGSMKSAGEENKSNDPFLEGWG